MKKFIVFLFIVFASRNLAAQNVGINNNNPQAALDVNGDIILRNSALNIVNGANENIDISTQKSSHYTLNGNTGVFDIGGFSGGIDGKTITVYNPSAAGYYIKHLSGGSLLTNQIHTGTGIDIVMSSYSSATFRYQAIDNLWHLTALHNEQVSGGGGGSEWTTFGTNISNSNTGNVGIGAITPLQKLDVNGASILANSTIIDPDLYGNRVVAGRIADGSGFDVLSGIGGNASTNILFQGRSWALGHNGTNFYIGSGTGLSNTIQTGIQINTNRNVVLVPISGNVGIAEETPSEKLQINNGNVKIGKTLWASVADNKVLKFGDGDYVTIGEVNGDDKMELVANEVTIKANNGNVLIPTGNVGIGTINPSYKLSVNGNIRAKEVVVETGWADFVFSKDYKLPALSEVEKYIKANNHLPEIPSAEEIQTNGLKVGELQTKMMQKIEELTLYVIELEKKIALLKSSNYTKK
jgi:hypothetical protein